VLRFQAALRYVLAGTSTLVLVALTCPLSSVAATFPSEKGQISSNCKERCKKLCDAIHDRCHQDCTKDKPTKACHDRCNQEYGDCIHECDKPCD
jgi:hypothetical protein